MRRHIRFIRGAWVALLGAAALPLAGQDNPGWWGNYGVVTVAIPSPGNSTLYNAWVAQNYLPANLGQLKNFAAQAQAYLDTALAGVGGAGPGIGNIVANFTVSSPYNFSPVNFGQIKAVATPIYDRLYEVGFSANVGLSANYGLTGVDGWNATLHYPWPAPPDPGDTGNYNTWVAHNYQPVNLGQLKLVFSFDLSTFAVSANLDANSDGYRDAWEVFSFGAPLVFLNSSSGNSTGDDVPYYEDANATIHTAGNLSITITYPASNSTL